MPQKSVKNCEIRLKHCKLFKVSVLFDSGRERARERGGCGFGLSDVRIGTARFRV
jgi:hypothetical protein